MFSDPVARSIANIGSGAVILDLSREPWMQTLIKQAGGNVPGSLSHLIFLHIPRTGGSVFLRSLEEWYAPGNVLDTFPQEESQCYDKIQSFVSSRQEINTACIHLHVPYPIDQVLEGRWSYMTFLRHPVDRVVSQYRILTEAAAAGRVSCMGDAPGSLADYLERYPEHTTNLQCKYLLNLGKFTTDVRSTCLSVMKGDNDALATEALAILESRFAFVGILELWSLSMLAFTLWSGRAQIPLMYDFMDSVGDFSPSQSDVAEVEERSRADILLYDKARQAFQNRHTLAAEVLKAAELPAFHIRNASDPKFAALRSRGGFGDG